MKVLAVALAFAPVTNADDCDTCIAKEILGVHTHKWCLSENKCELAESLDISCTTGGCVSDSKAAVTCRTSKCPPPAPPTPPPPPPPACLCVFDVERTLTAKQSATDTQCPGTVPQPNVTDTSYGGGKLVLSDAAMNIDKTFCNECYNAMVTAEEASGPDMHADLIKNLAKGTGAEILMPKGIPIKSNLCPHPVVTSPLVICWKEDHKQGAVDGLIEWYKKVHSVTIDDVYMFDDRKENIVPFKNTKYNAQQVSCKGRDHATGDVIGFCGATAAEIGKEKKDAMTGNHLCPKLTDEVVV